jgi:hypothetical protein
MMAGVAGLVYWMPVFSPPLKHWPDAMRVTASSMRSLATSAANSGTVRLPGITLPTLPRLAVLTQFANVPLGIAMRCAASSSDSPCANTSLTALARNSGVYVFVCILRSPFDQFIKRECPKKSGYLNSAYVSQKELIRGKAPKAKDFTNKRVRRAGEVDEARRAKNRSKSKIRAWVEDVFAVVKRLWGFTKVRYRGLAKNASRAFTALALANIYLVRHRLMAPVRP